MLTSYLENSVTAFSSQSIIMGLTICKNLGLRDTAPLLLLLIRDGALAYVTIFGAHTLHVDLIT